MAEQQDTPNDLDASKAPLLEHLIEFRGRLMKSFAALIVLFFACYYFSPEIYDFLDANRFAVERVLDARQAVGPTSREEAFSRLINAGAYALQPEILDEIGPGFVSMEREVFPKILPKGMYGFGFDGHWLDCGTADEDMEAVSYIFEPGTEIIQQGIITRTVRQSVFNALLHSLAGEHGARMTSMDSATNNCSDLIDQNTLRRNRARQASITTELVEITSGAEALKG